MATNLMIKKEYWHPDIIKMSENKAEEDIKNAESNGLKSRFQTNELQNKTIGNIGEHIFKQYLKENNIIFETNDVTGQKDKYDFKINQKTVDVKTFLRKQPLNRIKPNFQIMINKKQLEQHPCDYYVFILIHGENQNNIKGYEIVGFLTKNEIPLFPLTKKVSEAYWIPFGELKPINLLIEFIEE